MTKTELREQERLALLLRRLCDPVDTLYDEEFAKGMNEIKEK